MKAADKPDISIDSHRHSPEQEQQRRFAGIARVYGDTGLANLAKANICVIGIGGVGSWVVESLARSAVGSISMIDLDVVASSNINRQILATSDSIGRDKVAVMRERILQINPACKVTAIDDFISKENLSDYLHQQFDFVIDCIDDFRLKAALINHCKAHKIKIITTGGAGGQTDPAKITRKDLSNAKQDVLLACTRKLLRQDYGFPRNLKRTFGVPCVYSEEQLVYPNGAGGVGPQRPTDNQTNGNTGNALSCAGGIGSITHVTATFGFFITAFVLNSIAHHTEN